MTLRLKPTTGKLLTTVWTMWGLCMRKLFTVWNTSNSPSALTRSKILLSAMNVPVRPAPALQHRSTDTFFLKNAAVWATVWMRCLHSHLQCTAMGWSPDCCCCRWTEAMMSIIPFPSAGIPTSGQPWKWKCLITLVCFSFGGEKKKSTKMSLSLSRFESLWEKLRFEFNDIHQTRGFRSVFLKHILLILFLCSWTVNIYMQNLSLIILVSSTGISAMLLFVEFLIYIKKRAGIADFRGDSLVGCGRYDAGVCCA